MRYEKNLPILCKSDESEINFILFIYIYIYDAQLDNHLLHVQYFSLLQFYENETWK